MSDALRLVCQGFGELVEVMGEFARLAAVGRGLGNALSVLGHVTAEAHLLDGTRHCQRAWRREADRRPNRALAHRRLGYRRCHRRLPGAVPAAVNDVHYLVDTVGAALAEIDDPTLTAQALLARLAAFLRDDITARGFPPGRTQPTCSLGLVLDHGHELELSRIGDVTIVAVGSETTELSTGFYNQREIAAVAAAGSSGLDSRDARQALLRRRREYITGVHAEGVFSGDPDAVLRVHATTVRRDDVRHILLCTDGFARAITDYQLFPDWPSLIEAALNESLSAIAKAIRDIEHHPEHDVTGSHFKRSDDLAAVLCAPDGAG